MAKDPTPQTIYLKDYTAPTYKMQQVHLEFDLFEDKALVNSTAEMVITGTNNSLFLNGEELNLIEISINDKKLSDSEYKLTDEGLQLANLPDTFTLNIKTEIYPQKNKAFSGLYKAKTIFCTQMEAEGFRRVTYFLDRPDALTKYTTTIRADKSKYPLLLSNGNLTNQKRLEGGRHECTWVDPFPKPSYLFALVAGDLGELADTYTTVSGRKVDLKLYVDKGNESRGDHAMESLKQSMKWDEDVFRREYDLDIYMIVAVDDFNMGAMENKGLNIFNSRYVLADAKSATDKEFHDIQAVIGHEYFHNWSGNRVTCRDWFQLSLKEGLTVFRDQEFSSDLNSRAVQRIDDVNHLRSMQFPEDAGPMAHPIRPEAYISIDNFYTMTVYEKGAEIIRMIYQILGHKKFHKGMDLYFATFDGQAVTTEDFVASMEKASGISLAQFQRWYSQAGTPEVAVSSNYDSTKATFSVTLKQETIDPISKKTNQPYHIPIKFGLVDENGAEISLTDENGKSLGSETMLHLQSDQETFTFTNIKNRPIPSLLREFSAPVKLNIEMTDQDLLTLMAHDKDSFNRWEASQKIYIRAISSAMKQIEAGQEVTVNAKLIAGMKTILQNPSDSLALDAQVLSLPPVSYFLQFQTVIDPKLVCKAYDSVYASIASKLAPDFYSTFENCNQQTSGNKSTQRQRRTLKNTALAWIGQIDDTKATETAYKQFETAENMTDSLAALSCLSNMNSPLADKAEQEFFDRWKNDSLVINKWFRVLASSEKKESFDRIKKLTQLPEFDKTNPNKIYSLLIPFSRGNQKSFHREDGKAYEFLADWVLDIDSRNPQVASRVVSSFNQWKCYDTIYKNGMEKALQRILKHPNLSKNVYEIVDRALK